MNEYDWRKEREKFKVPFRKEQETGKAEAQGGNTPPNPPPPPPPPPSGGGWKVIGVLAVLVLIGIVAFVVVPKNRKGGTMQNGGTSGLDGTVVKPQPSSYTVEKPVSDSAAMLGSVFDKYKHAVGIVTFWVKDSSGKVIMDSIGTAWACAPDKFATNAHVAHELRNTAQKIIQPLVVQKMMEKIERFEKEEKAKAVVADNGTGAAQNSRATANNAEANPDENARILMKLNEYQKKVGDEVMVKQLEETKAFVMKYLIKGIGIDILINQKNNVALPVVAVQVHPKYNPAQEVLSPDVSILTVSSKVKDYFPIADEASLHDLKAGMPVGFLGFPMENLVNRNVNLESPVATMQTGIITAVSDFDFKEAGFYGNYCIRHNMPSAGGASGSPIFNVNGQVVALLNGGNMETVPEVNNGEIVGFHRTPHGALVEFAVRVDLLKGLRTPVPIQKWLLEN